MRRRWSSVVQSLAVVAALLLPTTALAEDAPVLIATGATGGSINSLGEVMWSQQDPATGQQQLFSSMKGQLSFPQYNDTYPQYDQYPHSAPSLNNMGDTAWIVGDGYGSAFLGGSIGGKRIDGTGMMPPIVGPDSEPKVNDRQEVVWSTMDTTGSYQIYSNLRGRLTTDQSNYYRPSINNNGDAVFIQYGMGPGQVYKLASGTIIPQPVTGDTLDHIAVAINDNGEMVWAVRDVSGTSIVSTTRGALPIAVTGDLSRLDVNNCGDVIYSVNESGIDNVYRWGNNAPCIARGQNVDQSQATAVKFGDIFPGAVDAASVAQWYKFEASAGQPIRILANYDTRTPNSLAIGLYDGQGNLVSGPTSSSPFGIATSAAYSGTYYLKAQSVAGAFPFYLSLSNYSQNCGAGPCQELIAPKTDSPPSINSLGEVVWRQWDPVTRKYPIFSSTRGQLPVIIAGDGGGPVAINNHGDLVWADNGSTSYVRALIAGQEITLASGPNNYGYLDINDLGEVIWGDYDGYGGAIRSNIRGKLTDSTVYPAGPVSINNKGEVVFVDANTMMVLKIAGGTTATGIAMDYVSGQGWSPAITDVGEIFLQFNDDYGNTRFYSTAQGALPYVVPGGSGAFDVNNCGDLLYTAVEYPNPSTNLYLIGLNAPCMTEPTRAFALGVTKNTDGGGGNVTSSPAGISLTAADNLKVAAFDAGTVVTLTATPNEGSIFVGWTGACSGNGVCQVTMDQAKTVQAVFTVGYDTTAPTVTITSPVAGYTKNYGSQILYSVSDGTVVTKVDGVLRPVESGSWLGFTDGTHVVRVESTDSSGNLGFAEVTFTVDTVAPAISLTSPAGGVINSNQPVLTYTVSEGTVVVKVDGLVVSKVSGDTLDTLTDGYHTIRIESTDAAGNFSYADRSFTVDTTPPGIIISQPTAGYVGSNTPPLSYTIYNGGPAVVKVDGVVVNKVAGDTLDPLPEGPHTLRIESTDAVGNAGFAECNFTVDSLAPVISVTSPVAGYTKISTFVLDYTVDEANLSLVQVLLDQAATGKVSGDTVGPLLDGNHSVTVRAWDKVGRLTETVVRFVVDTRSPSISISSPYSGFTRNNTPLLSYTVTDSNAVKVVVKVDGAVVDKVSGSTLDALADGYHTVRVEGTDAAGNFSAMQVGLTVDTAAPVVAISSPAAGTTLDNTPYLNYTVSDGTVSVKVDGLAVATRSGSSLSALANGTHTLTVQSTDAAGNIGSASVTFTVNWAPLAITTPSLPFGTYGANYSQTVTAAGGVPGYTFSLVGGSLPRGVTLDPATGALNGVPNATGSFSFTVKLADSDGASVTKSYTVNIYDPLSITTTWLSAGYAAEQYSQTVGAFGGNPPYTWTVATGALPQGLTLDSSTGAIAGTPSVAGTFNFSLQVSDGNGTVVTKALSITINPARPDLTVTSVSGPSTVAGGKKITVYATVENRGAGTSLSSAVSFYLSSGGYTVKLADAVANTLASGASQTVAVTVTVAKEVPLGAYNYVATVDPTDAISESNESNNTKSGNSVYVK